MFCWVKWTQKPGMQITSVHTEAAGISIGPTGTRHVLQTTPPVRKAGYALEMRDDSTQTDIGEQWLNLGEQLKCLTNPEPCAELWQARL